MANLCVDHEFTDAQATGVLQLLKDGKVVPENIRFNNAKSMRRSIERNAHTELAHAVSLKQSERDGKGALDLAFRNIWEAAKMLVRRPELAGKMYLRPESPTRLDANGRQERIFGPYNTGLFFHAMQEHFGPDVTILFIHLFSDILKQDGRARSTVRC